MALTYKRQDDLEKMLKSFAILPDSEKVEFLEPKKDKKIKKADQ